MQSQSFSFPFVSSVLVCFCLYLWVSLYYICIVLCIRLPWPVGKPWGFIAICNKIELEAKNKINKKLALKVKWFN